MPMPIIVIKRQSITRFLLLILTGIVSFFGMQVGIQVYRTIRGVRPGVTLEGQLVAGLLPSELARKITQFAYNFEIEPRNAIYFSETGEIIPEKTGIRVDVEKTMARVFSAGRNQPTSIVTARVQPEITEEFFKPVFTGPEHKKEVALTFNVDWGEEYLPGILEILRASNAKATFFVTGSWVRKYPGLIKEIVSAGHEIGNHGFSHVHVNGLTRTEIGNLISQNEQLIKQICGYHTALFAPPYGEFNDRIVTTAGNLGYRTILWTIDTIDWQNPPPAIIINRVSSKLNNGAIILAHPTATTLQALPQILKDIEGKNLKCMTVSELLKN